MQVLTKEELNARKILYCRKMIEDVFIYPTDTIYGMGCDATNGALVQKIRDMKGRDTMPFSVIAPSKDWVREHCVITPVAEKWLDKLPGPYTLILTIKDEHALPFNVTCGRETLGVRMPNHWISDYVAALKTPIITTSANVHGHNHMRTVDDIPSAWRREIPFVIEEGEIGTKPSTIVNVTADDVIIRER